MLRAVGRFLFAAKTSVKEPVKQKAVKKTKEKKAGLKVIDKSKWYHSRYNGNRLNDLVEALPKAPQGVKPSELLHKNGFGLKFYREEWARYPEPCYWTIVKYRPKLAKEKDAIAWGVRTWRGVTESLPRRIPSSHKKEWRILLEPASTVLGSSLAQSCCWIAPALRVDSPPQASTQLPDDLPGADPAKWPYPWGKLGSHNFPATNPRTPTETEAALAAREAEEDAQWAKEDAQERNEFLATFGIVVKPAAAAAAAAEGAEAEAAAAAAPTTVDAQSTRIDTQPDDTSAAPEK